MIVAVMSEPEWTQRGKSFGMWRDDKAADDQAKQEPGSSSGKEMAKGFKHLVQVKQSRHTVPLLNGVIRETYRMSAPSNWPPPSACWAECRVLRRGTSELTTQEDTLCYAGNVPKNRPITRVIRHTCIIDTR